jgi:hypothetical protein
MKYYQIHPEGGEILGPNDPILGDFVGPLAKEAEASRRGSNANAWS